MLIFLTFKINPYPHINDIKFNQVDIIEAINELSSNFATGPDGFPAILFKESKEKLAAHILHFLRTSFDEGRVLTSSKTVNITPVHKGRSRSLSNQYCLTALTSHFI